MNGDDKSSGNAGILLNVCLICVHSSPLARLGSKDAGGMNVYIRELCLELGKLDVSVDIFTRQQNPDTPPVVVLSPNIRVISLLADQALPDDKYRLLSYLPDFVREICAFAEQQQIRYHLIHSHYWVSGEVALLLRDRWHIPVVHMFHTLGAMKNIVAQRCEDMEPEQRIAIERRLCRKVDALVAATPRDRDQIVEWYEADVEHIAVIPGGVNLQHFYPMPQSVARSLLNISCEHDILVCVGRIEPLKGIDCLLRATALLYHHRSSLQQRLCTIIIGGEPEDQPETWNSEQHRLAALCVELGISSVVSFLGTQPQTMLPYYYAAADVCVVPSRYESFGLVALEAQACGSCVVASDVGGLSYIIEDGQNGVLVPVDNPQMLADRLEWLLINQSYRAKLGAEAHRHALQFGWNTIAEKTLNLYRSVFDDTFAKNGMIR